MQGSLFGHEESQSIITANRKRSPHQEAVDGWTLLWLQARGVPWTWRPRDLHFVKLGLKLAGTPWAYLERARRLLTQPPTVWYAQNASPTLLYSRWNELGVEVRPLSKDEQNRAALLAAAEALQ